MSLSDRDIQFGFEYCHKDDGVRNIIEVSEYSNDEQITINCTQLGDFLTPQFSSQKEKKRILNEWCEFLNNQKTNIREVNFGTRMPQVLFDAMCNQKELKIINIKWGAYTDLSALENLEKIEKIHIGSGASIASIDPISKLNTLKALSIENFQKISDYSAIGLLDSLESLNIEGDGMGPQYIKINSLRFLENLPNLRFLRILTERLQDKDYSPINNLKNIEHLTLGSNREIKRIYADLIRLPKLKWGLLIEKPDLYE
jgi:hypothetical protein